MTTTTSKTRKRTAPVEEDVLKVISDNGAVRDLNTAPSAAKKPKKDRNKDDVKYKDRKDDAACVTVTRSTIAPTTTTGEV